jgi:hypothetical protein
VIPGVISGGVPGWIGQTIGPMPSSIGPRANRRIGRREARYIARADVGADRVPIGLLLNACRTLSEARWIRRPDAGRLLQLGAVVFAFSPTESRPAPISPGRSANPKFLVGTGRHRPAAQAPCADSC